MTDNSDKAYGVGKEFVHVSLRVLLATCEVFPPSNNMHCVRSHTKIFVTSGRRLQAHTTHHTLRYSTEYWSTDYSSTEDGVLGNSGEIDLPVVPVLVPVV